MLCQDIINILDTQSPKEYALEWDNVGLLVGRRDKEVNKLLIAVDATLDVIEQAIEGGYDMIVTHHPMIFSKLRKINDDTVLGRKIMTLVEHGICCYAMHTNFDTVGGMGRLAAKLLGLVDVEILDETLEGEGIGCIGKLCGGNKIKDLAVLVKDKFGLKNVMLYGDADACGDRIAICPGSGKSVIDIAFNKGADCLITGDIGHHDGIDAVEMGLNIIDASHYGLEKIFMQFMHTYLNEQCAGVQIDIADTKEPFVIL